MAVFSQKMGQNQQLTTQISDSDKKKLFREKKNKYLLTQI